MILVNYIGDVRSMPETFRHHDAGLSYADICVPAFLFAVGVGYRLTFLRRMQRDGIWAARWAAVKRNVLLIVIAVFLYGIGFGEERPLWEGIAHLSFSILAQIGLAALLALPVIERGAATRLITGLFYCAIFQAAYQLTGYGAWMPGHAYDSGPLGALTRAFPLLMGTVMYDLLVLPDRKRLLGWGAALGLAAAAVGYGLSFIWGFSKPYDAVPYVIFTGGICMLVYLGFYQLSDRGGVGVPTFTAIGRNALAIYVGQDLLLGVHRVPEAAPAWMATAAFVLVYLAIYAVARYLDRSGYYIRI